MKLILTLILMCFFVTVHAVAPHKLNVDILNLGAENCVLSHSEILSGTVLEGNIPQYLPGNGMVMHFAIGSRNAPPYPDASTDGELYLTYQCGWEKHITLYMKQMYKHKHHHGTMVVKMTDAVDVHEVHEVISSNRINDSTRISKTTIHPGYIQWTLWN